MKNEERNEKKRDEVENHSKKIIALALALVLLIGGTYAWLTLTLNGNKTVRLEAGTLSLNLTNEANEINMLDAVPVTDADGMATTPYTFTLENNGTIPSDYSIFLDKMAIDTGLKDMPQHRIKFIISKTIKEKVGDTIDSATDTVIDTDDGEAMVLNPTSGGEEQNPNRLLDSGSIEANQYIEYTLRLWIDQNATSAEMNDTAFKGQLRIEATQQDMD